MRIAATGQIAQPITVVGWRESVASAVRLLALASLSVAIVLSLFRARIFAEARPDPGIFSDYTDYLVFWSQVFVAVTLGLWLISLLVQPRRIDFGPWLISIPVAVLVVMTFVAAPYSDDSSLAWFNAVSILSFIALAVFVLNEVKSIGQVLPAIGVMVVVQAVVAITQVISQDDFGLTFLGEIDLDPARSGVSVLWTDDQPRLLRAYGLSDHPNILAGVLGAGLLVLLAGIARYRDAVFAIACGVFGVGVAAVMVSFSRGGALGLATGLLIALLLLALKRDWRTLALWAAACVVAVVVTLPLVRPYTPYLIARANPEGQAVGSTEERSVTERDAVNRNTVDIIGDNPVIGVGAGVLPTMMKQEFPEFAYHYQPAHIAIVTVIAETGVVGGVAYGVLILAPWVLLWKRRRHLTPELIGVSGAVMAITVVGLFDYYTWGLMAGRFWFWFVLGLWVAVYRASERQASHA
jgi:O-antigen ligase/polysaccharide polymerase Wzy-like membrane protein